MNNDLKGDLFSVLLLAILKAEAKHPHFPFDPQKAEAVIAEEHLELIREINDRSEDGQQSDRIFAETLDLAVVVCRFLMRQIEARAKK